VPSYLQQDMDYSHQWRRNRGFRWCNEPGPRAPGDPNCEYQHNVNVYSRRKKGEQYNARTIISKIFC